jgi:hypothetical protein
MSEDARVEAALTAYADSIAEQDKGLCLVSRNAMSAALAAAAAVPEPIAPDDTAERDRLETIVGKAVNGILPKNVTIRDDAIGYTAITAYLEAVRGTVVSTDDLREAVAAMSAMGTDDLNDAAYRRLRAKVERER